MTEILHENHQKMGPIFIYYLPCVNTIGSKYN